VFLSFLQTISSRFCEDETTDVQEYCSILDLQVAEMCSTPTPGGSRRTYDGEGKPENHGVV
jgi:hypothetical protein